jgi:hypothetical protein
MSRYDYNPDGKSEVARLMYQIERSCEAIARVMNDPGYSASHEMIRRRYAALGERQEQLGRVIGQEASIEAMYDIYNDVLNRPIDKVP